MPTRDLIATHPQLTTVDRELLLRCIDDCIECAEACTICADASLAEPDVREMVRCIRLCLDCSDICAATARVVTRQTTPAVDVQRALVEACAVSCRVCGDECERWASHHEHCRLCLEVCRRCEESCRALAAVLS